MLRHVSEEWRKHNFNGTKQINKNQNGWDTEPRFNSRKTLYSRLNVNQRHALVKTVKRTSKPFLQWLQTLKKKWYTVMPHNAISDVTTQMAKLFTKKISGPASRLWNFHMKKGHDRNINNSIYNTPSSDNHRFKEWHLNPSKTFTTKIDVTSSGLLLMALNKYKVIYILITTPTKTVRLHKTIFRIFT